MVCIGSCVYVNFKMNSTLIHSYPYNDKEMLMGSFVGKRNAFHNLFNHNMRNRLITNTFHFMHKHRLLLNTNAKIFRSAIQIHYCLKVTRSKRSKEKWQILKNREILKKPFTSSQSSSILALRVSISVWLVEELNPVIKFRHKWELILRHV